MEILKTSDVLFKGGPNKQTGIFTVFDDKVSWTGGAASWSLTFDKIRGQRVSPSHKPKVQLQVCPVEGDPFTFIFVQAAGHDEQLAQREAVKDAIQNVLVQRSKPQVSATVSGKTANVSEKEKLLAANKTMATLYEQLVSTGIITPKQFWSEFVDTDRKKLRTEDDTNDVSQPMGISGAFLSSIQQHDGCNNISLNLTQHVRQQIFGTYPAVKQRYTELVPSEMDEMEFWTAFFQSHYFHRDRTLNLNPKEVFASCLKLDDQTMHDLTESSSNRPVTHYNLEKVNDDALNYLREEPSKTVRGSSQHKSAIIRQFNFHSSRVLDSTDGDLATGSKSIRMPSFKVGHRAIGYQTPAEAAYSSAGTSESPDGTISVNLAEVMTNGHGNDAIQNGDAVDRQCLRKIRRIDEVDQQACTQWMQSCSRQLAKSAHVPVYDAVITKTVRALRTTLDELLRHFWSCFPVNTPDRKEKLDRTILILKRFDEERINREMAKFEYKYREHMDQLMTAALIKFDQYQARTKKTTKRKL